METSAKKARRRGRRGWRGGGDDRRARSNEAPGARSIAAPVARRGSRRSSREHAPRTPTAAAHSAAITSRTLARILRRIVPTTRARRCGRAREKTAKRAGVETRRAVRRRRSRSLRAGFPCASRGVDERSRACGPSRTYARGCDRRGGGGCQRNESRARFGIRPRRPHPRPSIDPRLGLDARLGLDTPLGSTNTIGARR